MPLLNVKVLKYVQKKVNLEQEVNSELKSYIEFLGLTSEKEEDMESQVINETLKYIFDKDKDFQKFKKNQKETTDTQK